GLEDTLDMAQGRTSDLSRALDANDFDEALDLAERAQRAVETMQGRLGMEDQVAQRYPGFSRDPAGVRKSLRGATEAQEPLQAIEKLSQFQDAMEKLAKQSGKGGGQGGIPMPWGEPAGDGNEDEGQESDGVRHDRVEIPDAESSRAPSEFRKELLDAMKQAP